MRTGGLEPDAEFLGNRLQGAPACQEADEGRPQAKALERQSIVGLDNLERGTVRVHQSTVGGKLHDTEGEPIQCCDANSDVGLCLLQLGSKVKRPTEVRREAIEPMHRLGGERT